MYHICNIKNYYLNYYLTSHFHYYCYYYYSISFAYSSLASLASFSSYSSISAINYKRDTTSVANSSLLNLPSPSKSNFFNASAISYSLGAGNERSLAIQLRQALNSDLSISPLLSTSTDSKTASQSMRTFPSSFKISRIYIYSSCSTSSFSSSISIGY